MVRALLLYAIKQSDAAGLAEHVSDVLLRGIQVNEA